MKQKPFTIASDAPPAKQAILGAALKLFAACGVDGVTIRDVAEEAGFTNPALYKHYKSKEDMAQNLFEACFREMVARMEVGLKGDMPFHGQLDHYLTTMMELYKASPEGLDFVNDNMGRFWPQVPEEMATRTQVSQVREILQRGRKEGAVTKDQPLELQVTFVLGLFAQLARFARHDGLSKPITSYKKECFLMLEKLFA